MAKITGRVVYIYPAVEIPSKTPGNPPFHKRDFVIALQTFDRDTGEAAIDEDNTPILTMTGDRCSQLESVAVGQMVAVTYGLRGRRYRDNDGKEKIITDINVTSVGAMRGGYVPQSPAANQQQDSAAGQQNDDLPF